MAESADELGSLSDWALPVMADVTDARRPAACWLLSEVIGNERRTVLQLPALAGLGWALPALSMVNPEKVWFCFT